jgi:hypothetical protein
MHGRRVRLKRSAEKVARARERPRRRAIPFCKAGLYALGRVLIPLQLCMRAIFHDPNRYVRACGTFKSAFVMIRVVRLDACKPHL